MCSSFSVKVDLIILFIEIEKEKSISVSWFVLREMYCGLLVNDVINTVLIEGDYDVCSWLLTDDNHGQSLVLWGIPL